MGNGEAKQPLMLVVDDERDIANMLRDYFELQGFRVRVACDGPGAIEAAACAPDVMLLDVNLPGCDGFAVCRAIREHVSCPIVFLTARLEDADMIAGFASGGDDYVTKPFSLEVLGARVRAQLARDQRRRDRGIVRFSGGIAVDFARMEVQVNGSAVPLARKDYDILELLAKRPGQVFDRDMIYELVWNRPGDSSVVTEHIRRLRRALADAGAEGDPIKTVWGVGYSWRA